MHVVVRNKQRIVPIKKERMQQIAEAVVQFERAYADEVGVHFVSSRKIASLHAQYFNDPSPTDTISFPIEKGVGPGNLGDVFVCPETAKKYCQTQGGSVEEEITLYLIHGLLHLMGYDDIKEAERKKMRKAEKKHMNHLRHCGLL